MLQIVTWKWSNGDHPKKHIEFSHEHINRFYRMLDRHSTVPYEAVCITDDPRGIDPHIRIIPLWDDHRDMGGCYVRLKSFHKGMKQIIGDRFIWFDIDTVITSNVDHILKDESDLKFWGDTHPRTPYNGSMCMHRAGSAEQIWTDFDPKASPRAGKRLGYVGTDQAWISTVMGPHLPKWGQADGIYSLRCHFEKLGRTELPANACIIMFHGRHDPSHREAQARYPWILPNWR